MRSERSGPEGEGKNGGGSDMKLDQKGYSPNLVVGIGITICVLVLVAWLASTFIGLVPENSDSLGVISTLTEYGPTLFKVLIVSMIFIVLLGVIRMLVGKR
ncbi:MAG: hypothetical protein QW356_06075 [Candidatus Hadarchaeales archaeon]